MMPMLRIDRKSVCEGSLSIVGSSLIRSMRRPGSGLNRHLAASVGSFPFSIETEHDLPAYRRGRFENSASQRC